ncbi:Transcriptional regulator [Hahella chejuensis KCTC 2396]|uniref:Transcriptional regulator n=1 Tax=Hahella chejuensis (strain KCTC 2396) TaxID=349521 RepID=Q2SHL9_HAHCH|nr:phosphonate utilization transcriptional regulator PhnR [Hahella chejuensis]ABC29855.1 Transcriptional regulator [Hahella chejuensis KCTC 2396]
MEKQIDNHYRYLQQHFSYLIRQQALLPGEKLPSERDIGERFNLTRMTVRQGLQTLEAEGLIYRQNRRGWFVSPPAVVYNPARRQSFIEYVSSQGFEPSTDLIGVTVNPADARMAELMKVDKGARLLFLQRRRSIDGRPVLIEHIYINTALLPGIEKEDMSQSLTHLLRNKYGQAYHSMNLIFKSTALLEDAARELGAAAGLPGLHIERTNYDAAGRVLELDYEYWRHDAVTIQIDVNDA